jgi:hypothetical protein
MDQEFSAVLIAFSQVVPLRGWTCDLLSSPSHVSATARANRVRRLLVVVHFLLDVGRQRVVQGAQHLEAVQVECNK